MSAGPVDVAVVGAGMVGRPLALALARAGLDVALIDRGAPPAGAPEPLDARCTALAAGTVDWLRAEGLWHPEAARAEPIRRVRVSHRGRFGATRIDAAELGRDALGEVVDNAAFAASLDARLAGAREAARGDVHGGGRVRTHGRASVAAVREAPEALGLELRAEPGGADGSGGAGDSGDSGGAAGSLADGASTLEARLLVVADGAGSTTRGLLGIGTRRVDHDQVAVLGGVALEGDHGGTAHERFTDTGPLALLPRPGRAASYVMCIDPGARGALEALDDAAWLAHLQARFGRRAGRFARAGARAFVPLARVEARATRASRALLVGNAARLLHPVAGQGYNLALRDVAALVDALEGAADPGDAALLARYERARRTDRRRTVALTDALARAFRGRAALPGRLRAAGLVGLDLAGPVRRAFARASAGL